MSAWIRRRWRRILADLRYLYREKVVFKSSRRCLAWCIIINMIWVVWKASQQPEDQRNVQDDFLTNMALREGLSGRGKQSLSRDSRVWNGWHGVRAIFAL